MTTEGIISHYNHLNGNLVGRKKLAAFHAKVKKHITDRRLDSHGPAGAAVIKIERSLAAALPKMNGHIVRLELTPVHISQVRVGEPSKAGTGKAQPVRPRRKKAKKKIRKVMREFKKGKLKSHGKPVTEPKQAVAIALREAGVPPKPKKQKKSALAGFTTADQVPDTPKNMIELKGPIGALLGKLQRYKLQIVIAGETHSSKSELGKQVADAFISAGFKTALVDWEQGGLESRDTIESIARNLAPENRKKLQVSSEVPRTLDAIKQLAEHFDVIVLDSGTKLDEVTNAWIDQLRTEYPDTIWVILMQQNSKGGTRGGTAAEFDAPVVIYTYRPDQGNQLKNYAMVYKNRGNKTGIYYNIAQKKLLTKEPS